MVWRRLFRRRRWDTPARDEQVLRRASTRGWLRPSNATFTQPLLRNFKIDGFRQQFLLSSNRREMADLSCSDDGDDGRATCGMRTGTWCSRWPATACRCSRSISRSEQLKNNRTRVEVGTLAPIDIIEAEAEVARNEEAVIVAEANIKTAEDVLRALVLNSGAAGLLAAPDRSDEEPVMQPRTIDVERRCRAALADRTDLLRRESRSSPTKSTSGFLQQSAAAGRQRQVQLQCHGARGHVVRAVESFPESVASRPSCRRPAVSFFSTFGNVFGNDFPTWSLRLVLGYPIGRSTAEADLARTQLQSTQSLTTLRKPRCRW